ncbi:hypothetical protein [Streptomyces sp. NBC_01264]|uniref:hypothetical protein n=1 Tax=Streptomyces sp. NBC_01264 TaxID=2903804 RepID=UPI002250BCBB|nr:hypothetical protein [Streptomyces sp. NBC_01264]MCX4780336.1 hypothetical protein [Streptomyces sp. NBC_01264]
MNRSSVIRSRPLRRPALPAAVLLALVLAGCSDPDGGSAHGEPELGEVAVAPATASISLPLDAYTDTDAETVRMGQVQQRLLSRCMARYGFPYEEVMPSGQAGAQGPEGRHRALFGAADAEFAAAHGYDTTAGKGRPVKPPAAPLSESATLVMHGERPGGAQGAAQPPDAASEEEAAQVDSGIDVGGQKVPPGGCIREAYRRLYAPTKDSVDLLFPFGLASEAHERSKGDSRVTEVLKNWSACMEKSGYTGLKDPYEVVQKLGLEADLGGPKAVTAAKADVACKREVNLVGVWAAVEKAYQQRLVEEQAETLALYKKQREARYKLAAGIV